MIHTFTASLDRTNMHVDMSRSKPWAPGGHARAKKGAITCSDLPPPYSTIANPWQPGWVNRDTVHGHASHHMGVILPFAIHSSTIQSWTWSDRGQRGWRTASPSPRGQLKSAARMERAREAETGMVQGCWLSRESDGCWPVTKTGGWRLDC